MELNTLKPAPGSKHVRKRVARGIGSGTGKTGGRGHKGQRARSGGFHKVGFEGGQMPLQRRLPKRGFNSPTREDTAEVLLSDLERVKAEKIDLAVLKEAGVVPGSAKAAKVIVSGKLTRKVTLTGVAVSKGARAAIEAAGGSTDAPIPQPKPKREPKVVPAPQPQAEARKGKEDGPEKHAGDAGQASESKSGRAPKDKREGKAVRAGGQEGRKSLDGHSEPAARQDRQVRRSEEAPDVSASGVGRFPDRRAHSGAGHRSDPACRVVPVATRRDSRPVQHVLRRSAQPLYDLRARHHAVYFVLDHHAAYDRRVPAAGAAQERGAGGTTQDHAVHPLRDRVSRAFPGDRHLDRARVAARAGDRPGPHVPLHRRRYAGDRHHVPDVALRAGDRARPGQRHLDHHLRRHRRGTPERHCRDA